MKCPVCDSQIANTAQNCPECGFADFRTEFINEAELEMWRRYVVYPCRFAYQTTMMQAKKLERDFREKLDAIQMAHRDMQKTVKATDTDRTGINHSSFRRFKPDSKEVWITKGNITYKSLYRCDNNDYTSCEISNIVLVSGYETVVEFSAKKTFDTFGANSTFPIAFRWKLKDNQGIVVADGRWSNDTMRVDDVAQGSISIRRLNRSIQYSLEIESEWEESL